MCIATGMKTPPQPTPQMQPDHGQELAEMNRQSRDSAGLASTIITGPQGVTTPAATTAKSLLGQ
jgi:hypothetical protein